MSHHLYEHYQQHGHGEPSASTPTPPPSAGAAGLLSRQLKQMQQAKDLPGISCGLVGDNVFEWEVMLMISDDCKYYGGTHLSYSLPYLSPHNII
jgi:hypothetical protein